MRNLLAVIILFGILLSTSVFANQLAVNYGSSDDGCPAEGTLPNYYCLPNDGYCDDDFNSCGANNYDHDINSNGYVRGTSCERCNECTVYPASADCLKTVQLAKCNINGVTYDHGTPNNAITGSGFCQMCDVSLSTTAWSADPSKNGLSCASSGTCQNGYCVVSGGGATAGSAAEYNVKDVFLSKSDVIVGEPLTVDCSMYDFAPEGCGVAPSLGTCYHTGLTPYTSYSHRFSCTAPNTVGGFNVLCNVWPADKCVSKTNPPIPTLRTHPAGSLTGVKVTSPNGVYKSAYSPGEDITVTCTTLSPLPSDCSVVPNGVSGCTYNDPAYDNAYNNAYTFSCKAPTIPTSGNIARVNCVLQGCTSDTDPSYNINLQHTYTVGNPTISPSSLTAGSSFKVGCSIVSPAVTTVAPGCVVSPDVHNPSLNKNEAKCSYTTDPGSTYSFTCVAPTPVTYPYTYNVYCGVTGTASGVPCRSSNYPYASLAVTGPSPAGFTISADTQSVTVPLGSSKPITITITVTRTGTFTGSVAISAPSQPAGVTVTPATIFSGQTSAQITISAASPLSVDSIVNVVISGKSSGLPDASTTIQVTVGSAANNPPVITTFNSNDLPGCSPSTAVSCTSTTALIGTAALNQLTIYSVAGSDPDGDAISFGINWGDGSQSSLNAASGQVSHTWKAVGEYTVTVTATDSKGATSSKQATIIVSSISASPNPCTILSGQTTCSTTVAWNSPYANSQVYAQQAGSATETLFASVSSGSQSVSVNSFGTTFRLYKDSTKALKLSQTFAIGVSSTTACPVAGSIVTTTSGQPRQSAGCAFSSPGGIAVLTSTVTSTQYTCSSGQSCYLCPDDYVWSSGTCVRAVTASHSPTSGLTTTTPIAITATAGGSAAVSQISIIVDGKLGDSTVCTSSPCARPAKTYPTGSHTYWAQIQFSGSLITYYSQQWPFTVGGTGTQTVTDIRVSKLNPTLGESITVWCDLSAQGSVTARIDGGSCLLTPHNLGLEYLFDCNAGSTTGQKTVRCISGTSEMTTIINVQSTGTPTASLKILKGTAETSSFNPSDAWTRNVASSPVSSTANKPFYLCAKSKDAIAGTTFGDVLDCTPFGSTGADGAWTKTGTFASADAGTNGKVWLELAVIGGTVVAQGVVRDQIVNSTPIKFGICPSGKVYQNEQCVATGGTAFTVSHSPDYDIGTNTPVTITPAGAGATTINIYVDNAIRTSCATLTDCKFIEYYGFSAGTHTYYATAVVNGVTVRDPASGTKSFTVLAGCPYTLPRCGSGDKVECAPATCGGVNYFCHYASDGKWHWTVASDTTVAACVTGTCGASNQACCTTTPQCQSGLTCQSNVCVASGTTGTLQCTPSSTSQIVGCFESGQNPPNTGLPTNYAQYNCPTNQYCWRCRTDAGYVWNGQIGSDAGCVQSGTTPVLSVSQLNSNAVLTTTYPTFTYVFTVCKGSTATNLAVLRSWGPINTEPKQHCGAACSLTYTDTAVTAGSTYYYQTAVGGSAAAAGSSCSALTGTKSNVASVAIGGTGVSPYTPPSQPFTLDLYLNGVLLRWTTTSSTVGVYALCRGTSATDLRVVDVFNVHASPPGKAGAFTGTPSWVYYVDTNVQAGNVYYYQYIETDGVNNPVVGTSCSTLANKKPATPGSITVSSTTNRPPTLLGSDITVTPTSGVAGSTVFRVTMSATDPEGNQVTFFVDWGDGSIQSLAGQRLGTSNVYTATASHIYGGTGAATYTIKVKAIDINNADSGLVTGPSVTISSTTTTGLEKTLSEGETTIVQVELQKYDVVLAVVSDADTIVVTVNGKLDVIDKGQTKTVNGLEIHVKDVSFSATQGVGSGATLVFPKAEAPVTGFRFARWTCADSSIASEGTTTTCKTEKQWRAAAEGFCANRCSNNVCGVVSFSADTTCDIAPSGTRVERKLSEGESTTVALDGVTYTIKLLVVPDAGRAAVYVSSGSFSDIFTMFRGETRSFDSRLNINLKDVFFSAQGGVPSSATFEFSKFQRVFVSKTATDKPFYKINEPVVITATVTSDSDFGRVTALITTPSYTKSETLEMKQVGCGAGSGSGSSVVTTECTYTATYTGTTAEGTYSVTVNAGDASTFYSSGYTTFTVLDSTKASQYIILNDIGKHVLKNVNVRDTDFTSSISYTAYSAEYSNGMTGTVAFVAVFKDRQSLESYLKTQLQSAAPAPLEKKIINGNLVYVIDTGLGQGILWTRSNMIIILFSTGVIQFTGAQLASAATTTQTSPPITLTPADVPAEILNAYLAKHPSDLGSIGTVTDFTLELKKGWNLISSPVFEDAQQGLTSFTSFQTNCQYASSLWGYSKATNTYVKSQYVTGERAAYWIKVADNCVTTIKGDGTYTMEGFLYVNRLTKGWNFVGGIPVATEFSKIDNDCTFDRGPFQFDTVANSWGLASVMQPGKGYIVNVAADCSLALEEELPPSLLDINTAINQPPPPPA